MPQPPLAASHLVVVNPASDPAAFQVVEREGNPANGTFDFEHAGTPGEGYRVFIVVTFDPPNPDGPIAVDQAVVAPATGC